MKRFLVILILTSICLSNTSCATTARTRTGNYHTYDEQRFYSTVPANWEVYVWLCDYGVFAGVGYFPIFIVDSAIGIVFDTICAPYDAVRKMKNNGG